MRNKNKILSGILALSAVACVSLGIAFQSDDAVNASAADSTMSVNTLGYLEWAQVDGATSYQVSSPYGTFTVEENRANVGDAITKAAKAAYAQDETATSTTVDFTVTPYTDDVAGEASTYTHTVESYYIDYGFSKTDLADAKNAEGEVLGASATVTTPSKNAGTNGVYNAISKNDLCTFTWSTAKNLTTKEGLNEWIYLFGKDGCTWENTSNSYYVWALRLRSTGVKVYLNGTGNSAKSVAQDATWNVLGDIFNFTGQFVIDVDYKFSVGVFDAYGFNGVKSGETIYVRLENATNQTLIAEKDMFVSNEVLTTSEVTEEDYNEASGLGICCQAAGFEATIKSSNTYDATYGAQIYQATGLSIATNGDIGVNMYADLNDVAKLNTNVAQMQITYKGETTTQAVPTAETTGEMEGYYKFSYAVAPKEIDEVITARLVIPGGPVGKAVQYSVRDYINSVQEGDAQYDIAKALEKYCESAVTYFDVTAEQPQLDETSVDFSSYAPTLEASDENVVPYGISLIVKDKTTIRFFFELTGEMPTELLANGEAVEATADETEGFYYIDLVDISANNLDEEFVFQVGDCKVKCYALTYGLSVLGMESDAKTVNLVKALYAYNQAANEFFGD